MNFPFATSYQVSVSKSIQIAVSEQKPHSHKLSALQVPNRAANNKNLYSNLKTKFNSLYGVHKDSSGLSVGF